MLDPALIDDEDSDDIVDAETLKLVKEKHGLLGSTLLKQSPKKLIAAGLIGGTLLGAASSFLNR